MTSGLTLRKALGDAISRAHAWPCSEPVASATLAALQALEQRGSSVPDPEQDNAFLQRVRQSAPSMLAPSELRRVLAPAWRSVNRTDPAARDWVVGVTSEALALDRRPTDRAIVTTWLNVFPEGAGAEQLAAAAAIAAERHDWPYRQAGRDFRLWNATDAVEALGSRLLSADDPDDVLRAAALTPGLYDARLVRLSLTQASEATAKLTGAEAHSGCSALLALVRRIGLARAPRAEVVRALLLPWCRAIPADSLRIEIQRFMLLEIGDPRTKTDQWGYIKRDLEELGYGADAPAILAVFKQWLVRASFELFFKLVSASTNKPSQWDRRERFWRHYLEKGLVSDARFVLGIDAERNARAQRQAIEDAGGFGRISDGAHAAQSALLMKIGDLTIAEWSDDGSCCFWQPGAANEPRWRDARYDGNYLRNSYLMQSAAARQRPARWHAKAHRGSWEGPFADHIRSFANLTPRDWR